jgi:aminomethyltransferase
MTPGYRALREGAAFFHLGARGHIRALGEDRVRLLHAMTTNHVEQLRPGQSCYAFFLTAQGRIVADVNILCLDGCLLLDTEPETRQKVYEHLDKYIIADDVTLEDQTERYAALALEGPQAGRVLGTDVAPHTWVERDGILIAGLSATGAPGARLFVPVDRVQALEEQLVQQGATRATPADGEIVRLENGKARCGVDFGEKNIPHETQLLHAIHFSKGCYLGQEIVERVRARGHVNRLLTPLRIDASQPPAAGATIHAGDQEAGEITSAAFSPALGAVCALGYVRAEALAMSRGLTVGGAAARPSGAKPV